jgi:hypothetical protein
MIHAPFKWFHAARGNDPDFAFTHCVSSEEKTAFDHSDDRISLFAVILPVIQQFDGKWIAEDVLRGLEAHTVFGEIALRFGVVPAESGLSHDYGLAVATTKVKRRFAANPPVVLQPSTIL